MMRRNSRADLLMRDCITKGSKHSRFRHSTNANVPPCLCLALYGMSVEASRSYNSLA